MKLGDIIQAHTVVKVGRSYFYANPKDDPEKNSHLTVKVRFGDPQDVIDWRHHDDFPGWIFFPTRRDVEEYVERHQLLNLLKHRAFSYSDYAAKAPVSVLRRIRDLLSEWEPEGAFKPNDYPF